MAVKVENTVPTLFRRIVKFVATIEPIVVRLIEIHRARLVAIAITDVPTLTRLDAEEQLVHKELNTQFEVRIVLLRHGARLNLNATDLRCLVRAFAPFTQANGPIDPADHTALQLAMTRLEALSGELRRESWANWCAMRKGEHDFDQAVNLIRHGQERQHMNPFIKLVPARSGTFLNARV